MHVYVFTMCIPEIVAGVRAQHLNLVSFLQVPTHDCYHFSLAMLVQFVALQVFGKSSPLDVRP